MNSNALHRLEEYVEIESENYFPDHESLEILANRQHHKNYDYANLVSWHCNQLHLSHWIEDWVDTSVESTIPSAPYYCDNSIASQDHSSSYISTLRAPSTRIMMNKKWPMNGVVEFRDLYLKYPSSSDFVLRSSCFHLR